jgi:hypothetical protein
MVLLLCETTAFALQAKRRMHVLKVIEILTSISRSELPPKTKVFDPHKPFLPMTGLHYLQRNSFRGQSQMVDLLLLALAHQSSYLPY